MEHLELVLPTSQLRESFIGLLEECRQHNENRSEYPLLDASESEFEAYISRLRNHSLGIGLNKGWVRYTTYWLVRDNTTVVGESRLRHELTPFLEREGGHIGYNIRHSQRRKGYGTAICAQTVQQARELGLDKVLILCDRNNIASARIIQKNGGVFQDEVESQVSDEILQRYWIDL